MLYLALLGLLSAATAFPYPLNGRQYKIPLQNGSFQLMSDVEIDKILKEEEIIPHYDAYKDVVFHLYTPSNPSSSQVVTIDDPISLRASNFDANIPTRVVIHGWGGSIIDGFMQRAKDQFLINGKFNVIAVDWNAGAGTQNYVLARSRVRSTGTTVGSFIQFLIREAGVNVKDVVVAGFSLGGHVAGNTGKQLNGTLPCIYSLDPAGPLFFLADSDRVMSSDAAYVEVIHTNTNFNGFTSPLGDVDFYPNGGKTQPGCGNDDTCDHNRAPSYFIESINSSVGFVGRKCRNFESVTAVGCDHEVGATKIMGGEPHLVGNGIHHLITNERSPFARG